MFQSTNQKLSEPLWIASPPLPCLGILRKTIHCHDAVARVHRQVGGVPETDEWWRTLGP